MSSGSARDLFFAPLLEYFESNAAKKVFLESPFLSVRVPKGGGYLKAIIYYEDITERTSVIKDIIEKSYSIKDFVEKLQDRHEKKKIRLEVFFRSKNEVVVPVRDVINMRRIFNGNLT